MLSNLNLDTFTWGCLLSANQASKTAVKTKWRILKILRYVYLKIYFLLANWFISILFCKLIVSIFSTCYLAPPRFKSLPNAKIQLISLIFKVMWDTKFQTDWWVAYKKSAFHWIHSHTPSLAGLLRFQKSIEKVTEALVQGISINK